ncbi:hypothetical protein [Pseudonocardia sp. MH-G8]|nr:hypothetical protein [Pseudonocardia sp. MH-G8]
MRRTVRRLTERLNLTPVGPEHADELWRLHQDPDLEGCLQSHPS